MTGGSESPAAQQPTRSCATWGCPCRGGARAQVRAARVPESSWELLLPPSLGGSAIWAPRPCGGITAPSPGFSLGSARRPSRASPTVQEAPETSSPPDHPQRPCFRIRSQRGLLGGHCLGGDDALLVCPSPGFADLCSWEHPDNGLWFGGGQGAEPAQLAEGGAASEGLPRRGGRTVLRAAACVGHSDLQ